MQISSITVLNEVLNAVAEAVLVLDTNANLCFYNAAAKKLLSLPEDAIGHKLVRYWPEKWPLDCLRADGQEKSGSFSCGERSFSWLRQIVSNSDFNGILLMLSEVTEYEETKEALYTARASRDELDAVLEASFDYIFVTDGQGNILKINESYERITGLRSEELLGKNIYDLVKQGFYDRAASIEVIETGKSTTFTQTIKTGKTVLVTGNPVFNEKGELIRVVTNGRDITELNHLKGEIEQAQNLRRHYQRELQKMQLEGTGDYIVASPKMLAVDDLIKRIARVDSTVLIYGASGVGKEFVAREIHENSTRKDGPYICINCAAIPDNLLEAELFGYEEGAFTGAKRGGKMGIFQLADGGTLFLDEIGEIPFHLQAKLLRVIQEREVVRVGGNKPVSIDVRIITATNRKLWEMVKDRQFREDLFYRLNVVRISIPPLCERKEEIPIFADHFISLLNKKYQLHKHLDPMILPQLFNYDWPGNIRELRNVLEQAFVTSPGPLITQVWLGNENPELNMNIENESINEQLSLADAMQQYESQLIREALQKFGSTRKAAAKLGVSQATIWRKAHQYGIALSEN